LTTFQVLSAGPAFFTGISIVVFQLLSDSLARIMFFPSKKSKEEDEEEDEFQSPIEDNHGTDYKRQWRILELLQYFNPLPKITTVQTQSNG
jgi:hypothetical protein